jgi:uncharacterized protein (TIGR04255 family)
VEHLPKAPIQEAMLDINAVLPADFDVATFKSFNKEIEQRFPEMQEWVEYVQGLQFAPGGVIQSSEATKSVGGYFFVSKSEGKVVQARRDGFTFNKLKPYSNWEDFKREAMEMWRRYVEISKPQCVQRLGLRYINRIKLPPDLKDLRDVCLLFPDIPSRIPQQLSEFFQRFVAPRDNGSVATVTLAIDNTPLPENTAIILDIDVSWHLTDNSPIDDTLWARFDEARLLKNEIFDASLTENAKSLFR